MKLPVVPPHISWPLFVIVLLLIGIGSAFAALFAARSDGELQVVDNYYQKAARWDELSSAAQRSAALHWKATVQVAEAATGGLRTVQVLVRDSNGTPVSGLNGLVGIRRPHEANAAVRLPLTPSDSAGQYTLRAPISQSGLWDFEISVGRDSLRFEKQVRIEVP